MSHKIIYLDDSITITDLINALRFSAYSVSNTLVPNAFVIRPNPAVLTDAQFKAANRKELQANVTRLLEERVVQLLKDKHER